MFDQSIDNRLTGWSAHRKQLDEVADPLQEICDFWRRAPFIPHNRKVDPYYQQSWPSPWEIIVDNKYDDFTKALMMGWTLKLTKKYRDSKIELKTLVDLNQTREYNVLYIDDNWVINYNDNGPITLKDIPDSVSIENLIDLSSPR